MGTVSRLRSGGNAQRHCRWAPSGGFGQRATLGDTAKGHRLEASAKRHRSEASPVDIAWRLRSPGHPPEGFGSTATLESFGSKAPPDHCQRAPGATVCHSPSPVEVGRDNLLGGRRRSRGRRQHAFNGSRNLCEAHTLLREGKAEQNPPADGFSSAPWGRRDDESRGNAQTFGSGRVFEALWGRDRHADALHGQWAPLVHSDAGLGSPRKVDEG
jgi:hypothetical protein